MIAQVIIIDQHHIVYDSIIVSILTHGIFFSSGHKDSVTCTAFSHDSKFVSTGDMSGIIKVWKKESGQEVWNFECGDLEVTIL